MTAEELSSFVHNTIMKYNNAETATIIIMEELATIASQQRTEGIKEGFVAAREVDEFNPYAKTYNTVEDYLSTKR